MVEVALHCQPRLVRRTGRTTLAELAFLSVLLHGVQPCFIAIVWIQARNFEDADICVLFQAIDEVKEPDVDHP